jgi:anti-sigma factor RsiW
VRRRTARDLAALADGSLTPERREALLRQIARSPELAHALEAQVHAIDAVRALATPAPPALHSWLDRATCEATRRRRHAAC